MHYFCCYKVKHTKQLQFCTWMTIYESCHPVVQYCRWIPCWPLLAVLSERYVYFRILVSQPAGSFFSTWSVLLRDLKPWLRLIQRLRLLPALWTAISMLTSTLYQDWVTMETGTMEPPADKGSTPCNQFSMF